MRIFRLAELLNDKYQLDALAATGFDIPDIEEARKALKKFREVWLDGPKVRDQSILVWADPGNKGEQFDDIRELISIVRDLSINPSLSPLELYAQVIKAQNISKKLRDHSIEQIQNAMITSFRGLRKSDIDRIKHAASKIRTFLSTMDSVYDMARAHISHFVPVEERKKLRQTLEGGYEKQTPKDLADRELIGFTMHPEASKYGLDDKEFLSYLINDRKLRPLVEYLIRAVKRGHTPKAAPLVLSAHDTFQDLQRKLLTNVGLFEDEESEALRQQIISPEEDWAVQMQAAKKQKALERQEEAEAEAEKARLAPIIQKRDEEAKQRQIEQDRERLIKSEGYSRLDEILKRYK